jgi:ATP-dependent helicase Lhr and Lhr-like helicase
LSCYHTGSTGFNSCAQGGSCQTVSQFWGGDQHEPSLRSDMTPEMWKACADAETRLCLPAVDDKALDGLKFSAALPRHLAEATLAQHLADLHGARRVLAEPQRFAVS